MVAGIPVAARVGYFGRTDMVRLTGYSLDSKIGGTAKNGTEINDAFSAMGVPSDYDVDTDGKYVEARLDWYHRLDSRIATRKLMSGYGLSLIYRDAKVDGASSTFLTAFGSAGGTVEIPEARARQIEALFTVGYMR
jgi:hypothetical protein